MRARRAGRAGAVRRTAGVRASRRAFVAELERSRVEPARLTERSSPVGRRRPAATLRRRGGARSIGATARRSRRAGLVDKELFAWRRARRAARASRSVGRHAAVRLRLRRLHAARARRARDSWRAAAAADVVVSLPFEPGRAAFSAGPAVHDELADAGGRGAAPDRSPTTTPTGRGRAPPPGARPVRDRAGGAPVSGGAVRLHAAGGERAEVELAAARALELLRGGTPPGEVAVVFRRPARYASLRGAGVRRLRHPVLDRPQVPLGHTGARPRAACPDPLRAPRREPADDLLAYLRTPGLPARARAGGPARGRGAPRGDRRTAAARAGVWEARPAGRWRSSTGSGGARAAARAPDRARSAGSGGCSPARAAPGRPCSGARARRRAGFPRGPRGARRAARCVAAASGRPPDDQRRARHAGGAAGPVGESPQPDRVQVASPRGVRARRFQAVFVCGLQEREFPRRAVARAVPARTPTAARSRGPADSGCRCARSSSTASATCSTSAPRAPSACSCSAPAPATRRATRRPSFFVDDVRAVLTDREDHVRRRSLSDVTWTPGGGARPPRNGSARWRAPARAAEGAGPGPLDAPAAVARSAPARPCPPARSSASPMPGEVAGGGRPDARRSWSPTPSRWCAAPTPTRARAHLPAAARATGPAGHAGQPGARPSESCSRSSEPRGGFACRRRRRGCAPPSAGSSSTSCATCAHEAGRDGCSSPSTWSCGSGSATASIEPVELADGAAGARDGRPRGHVKGHALVRDYKSSKKVDRYKVASWERENRFQAALYMLVVERGARPSSRRAGYTSAGRHRPAAARDGRRRAAMSSAAASSRRPPRAQEFREKLDWARERDPKHR